VSNVAATQRDRRDACPGALTLHDAADGGLARVRLPGGLVSGPQLATLAAAADALGDGRLELTSRGNVQIRALAPGASRGLGERLAAAGLLPSATHERVRNIVASPLAGIDNDNDLTALIRDLDCALCSTARLAELSGRFLFALDDGRGDVASLGADVTMTVSGSQARLQTMDVPRQRAVEAALAVAEAFLDERTAQGSSAWRIDELGAGSAAVFERARRVLGVELRPTDSAAPVTAAPEPEPRPEPAGVVEQPDGRHAVVALAPLGRLTAAQARLIAVHAGDRGVRITAWRSIVVPDLDDAGALAAAAWKSGLGVEAGSRWYRLSACTGRPGCAKSLADVQADAAVAAERWHGRLVHWSGCERRCGRPHGTEVDVVATAEGYAISE
jgi:precorrin-3B synthase